MINKYGFIFLLLIIQSAGAFQAEKSGASAEKHLKRVQTVCDSLDELELLQHLGALSLDNVRADEPRDGAVAPVPTSPTAEASMTVVALLKVIRMPVARIPETPVSVTPVSGTPVSGTLVSMAPVSMMRPAARSRHLSCTRSEPESVESVRRAKRPVLDGDDDDGQYGPATPSPKFLRACADAFAEAEKENGTA